MDFLSKREAEVMKEVLLGLPNKIIGERLFVTEKTVKFHLTNIYKKLNVTSRAEMIAKWSMGDITPERVGPFCHKEILRSVEGAKEEERPIRLRSEQKRIKCITEAVPSGLTTLPIGNQSLM